MRYFILIILLFMLVIPAHAQSEHVVIYATDAGVVALNPQTGSQSILLTIDSPLPRAYGFHLSPDAVHLAVYVRFSDESNPAIPFLYRLYVIRLADAALLLDQDLLPPDYSYPIDEILGDPKYELTRALGEVIWSPDSRYLAFISGHMGNADVFIFEPAAQTVFRLNDSPGTAAFLNWNRSGSTLIFSDLNSFGDGSGYVINATYAAAVPGGDIRPLPVPQQGISIIGWIDDTTLIYSPLDFAFFGASGLYTLNMNSLESTELLPQRVAMTVPIFDPDTQTIAFVVPDIGEVSLVPGAYLWRSGESSPTFLQSGTFYVVSRVRPGMFQYEDPSGSYLFSITEAGLKPLPHNDFGAFVSPVVDAVVLSRVDGTYVSHISTDDAALVWGGETQVPIWSPDGSTYYTYGTTDSGAGLVMVDVVNRTVSLLDSGMAGSSPRAVAP